MLKRAEEYRDMGEFYLDQLDRQHMTKRIVKRLQVLGFVVNLQLTPAGTATPLPVVT